MSESAIRENRLAHAWQMVFCTLACAFLLLLACVNPKLATAAESENVPLAPGTSAVQNITTQDGEEPIALGEIGDCSWVIDANGRLTVAPTNGESGTLDFNNPVSSDPNSHSSADHRPPWYEYAQAITTAEIEGTVFLTGVTGQMFLNCTNLVSVDLSGLDTSEAPSLGYMFCDCHKLVSVDMSMLDARSVQSTGSLFAHCIELENVKLPDFSKAKLEIIDSMFINCKKLISVDLSSIDTSAITSANRLFFGCSSLEKVIVGANWDLPSCLKDPQNIDAFFQDMFYNCKNLVGANGTSYATAAEGLSYARVDTQETPGYFWLAENSGDNPGDDPGIDPGTDPNTDPGTDPGTDPNDGSETDPNTNSNPDDNPQTGGNSKPAPTTSKATKSGKPTVKLSASTFAYNGKRRTPAATVTLEGKALKQGRDYSIVYSKGCKAIGSYKATVIGKGSYKFNVTKAFQIVPKTPKLKSLKAHKNSDGSSGFIVTWKKSAKKGLGYQIRWSPSKQFKKSALCAFKSTDSCAKKAKAALQVKNHAWLGKKAYVQVRAFKTVKGMKCYSNWSKAKTVKLKK